ncbi:MAG: lactonase family protein, partial [Cyclobacteriaceae bacterium]|nr:lactonase family protein [Cyclobacteriaceae bacterium]
MNKRIFFLLLVIFSITGMNKIKSQSQVEFLYIGTYTEADGPGIHVYRFDRTSGSLSFVETAGSLESPSYVTLHPDGRFLYSVNRGKVIPDKNWGSVSAFSIDKENGKLLHLNNQPIFGAEGCYISTDSRGRLAFVANYSTGNVVVFPILKDGSLGTIADEHQHTGSSVNPSRQKGPHAHCAYVSPDDKHLYVVDLGLDLVKTYEIDYDRQKLIPKPEQDGKARPGTGPRHITIDRTGKFAYAIEELSSSVTVYRRDVKTGGLTSIQHISTIPGDYTETNYCADIHIESSGKFLYGSNRGHDSLAIFRINPENGMLEPAGYQPVSGKWPRNFLIDPKGEFVFVA